MRGQGDTVKPIGNWGGGVSTYIYAYVDTQYSAYKLDPVMLMHFYNGPMFQA